MALNETFLNKMLNFSITGHDTVRNDRSTGQGGGVAFLVKHDLVINKENRNSDFNIITENEALAINLELSNNQNLILATIYCPNGNPNFSLFQSINNLSCLLEISCLMSCLLEISTRNRNLSAAPIKPLWSYAQKYPKTT